MRSQRGRDAWRAALLALAAARAFAQPAPDVARVERGGPPPPSSAPILVDGFVRAVDGDTLEAYIDGKRVGIAVAGIRAPRANTACGRLATARMQELASAGLRLQNDRGRLFDRHTLRRYRVTTQEGRRLIALELVREGLARARGPSRDRKALRRATVRARAAGRGCVWGGGVATLPARPGGAAVPKPLAPNLPSGFVADVIASGLDNPTALSFLPDGRILVAEKAGLVRIIKNGSLLPTPFVDIRGRVNDYWDRGLIGIAAGPDFATDGAVYLLYAFEDDPTDYTGPKTARLTRVTAAGDSAPLGSETVVLGDIPSEWYGHSIGNVKLAPDGTIFLTVGDAASWQTVVNAALRAQDLNSLAGKLLRVDGAGRGLPSNPFWNGDATAARSKVWAYGLRNAYRFNLKPGTSLPYLGEVGWSTTEEVDVVPAGANLGWPCYEGSRRQGGYEPKTVCQQLYAQGASAVRAPLVEYDHNGSGAAATGGAFYTGTSYPAQYQGAYFYGDYSRSVIWYLKVDAADRLVSGPTTFATGAEGPVDIEMGPDDSLYYVAINAGELRRIRAGAAAPPPAPPSGTHYLSDLAWLSMSNGWGPAERDRSNGEKAAGDGRPLTLNGVVFAKGLGVHADSDVRYGLGGGCSRLLASVGVDDEVGTKGSVVFQVWTDGTKLYDSGVMRGSTATKVVDVDLSGHQVLQLLVTNAGDGFASDHADWADARIVCGDDSNAAPVPTVGTPAAATGFAVGDVITFSGSATDAEDGAIPEAQLSWEVVLHHCTGASCHAHPFVDGTGSSGSFTVPDHGDEVHFEIILTAADSEGATGSSAVLVYPRTVRITLATVPSGLTVVYGGEAGTAPLVRTTVVGSTHTITAPSPQGGSTFVAWSDGGAAQHDVTVGETDVTYTATFTGSGPVTSYLSDLAWLSMINGWGPAERDRSNGEKAAGDGRPITLNGVVSAKGLGVHADSEIRYALGGACTRFLASVGVDDEVGTRGSVVFQVWADGTKLYDSGVMRGSSATGSVDVSVSGRQELRLVVTSAGDGKTNDHADWAGARVECSS